MAQPDTFGRYRVIRHLGSGSFATVWLAHDDRLDTPVAVKVLAENWSHQLDVHHRFMEEARILRQADSAWLVRVHDIGTLPDERPYFVMPYADQGSVADLTAKGPLPLDEALRLLTEIGQGVTVLHRHGTIHRDIKPSNVLLQSSPVGQRVLVADLGFAKAIDGASGFTAAAGTPGYMSPEQRGPGGDLDVRADVYSLGAVAYELITGRRPPPPPVRVPPRRLRPGVPRALDDVIMSALAEDRAARPSDAKAFTDRIRAIRMTPDLRSQLPWWVRYRRAWQRAVAAGVAAAALVAGTTGAAASTVGALTEVRYAGDDLHLAVPAAWAQQFHNGRAVPSAVESDRASGVLVATDLDSWDDPEAAVAGVFAALLPGTGRDLDAMLTGSPCAGQAERRAFTGADWSGEIREWSDCPGQPTTVAVALLAARDHGTTLYLEVRRPAHSPNVIDRIIAATRLER
ncbi:serine/threonine-protein kinase [Streptomonospora litoralis]|uniref:non-specific serine/threonine protein kinase n=1 Tax=Streptomonospora litoralis TaxID=2498135 RepID=A0A4P6PXT1_9ACTN|nr:serine/threonine-protein kinase [Streptomonospora litoralis]QBI52500.1 Serine/threonine-protein kinase PrkC [Streptomonospora litoralis]